MSAEIFQHELMSNCFSVDCLTVFPSQALTPPGQPRQPPPPTGPTTFWSKSPSPSFLIGAKLSRSEIQYQRFGNVVEWKKSGTRYTLVELNTWGNLIAVIGCRRCEGVEGLRVEAGSRKVYILVCGMTKWTLRRIILQLLYSTHV